MRVQLLADRRQEMMLWNTTLNLNTAASFRSFAASYPGSDLAPTARKLEERSRNRSLNANAASSPATAGGVAPAAPNATPIRANLPISVATAPATCPCSIQQAPTKKKEATKPPARRADTTPSRRVGPPTDDDIGHAADVLIPAIVGSGIVGSGIAGGMSRQPQGDGSYPPSGGGHSSGGGYPPSGGYSIPQSGSMMPHGR
jgi:hypothetical protein